MKQRGFRYCSTCKSKLQKWGRTKAGSPRWRCPKCKGTAVRDRPDLTKALMLERFVAWLLSKQSQAELGIKPRTWRKQIAWCWEVVPRPEISGEVYSILLLDGIRIGSLVCLIARTPKYVANWHWAYWESSNTWEELLKQLPAPAVVVCDGQKGILLAIGRCWPNARIQRCHFHIWQNVRSKLSLHPTTQAGQELLALTKHLLRGINTQEEAATWAKSLYGWEERWRDLLKERTLRDNPPPHKRKWWYTHGKLRSAYYQLRKLVESNQLFTYLETDLTDQPIPRFTNHVEGGINSQIRTKLKLHRGLSQQHQQRLVDWYLNSRTEAQKPTRKFL